MRKCAKCNRCIRAKASVVACTAGNCNKTFHQGCLRVYCLTSVADQCCISSCVAMGGQAPAQTHSPIIHGNTAGRPASRQASAPVFPQIVLPPQPAQVSLPSSWSNMTLDEKLAALMIKVTSGEQFAEGTHTTVQSIIPLLQQQQALIVEHGERLNRLESRPQGSSANPTNGLVIDNIPMSVELARTPITISQCLLDVLGIPELKSEILDARNFMKKAGADKFSILVSFKSNFTRDHVIMKKRQLGNLEQSQLFGAGCGSNQIFVNELLNASTYRLLIEAKKWKRESGWVGFIWVQNSEINVRKGPDRSVKPTIIKSLDELKHLA